ncbi:7-cyano-7-deazaguanine synthase [Paenibacillus hubeiensis]|uniref:7-cyano-7-deazaguanine synthase n=1 Tax=Paenibacillus hubeiensis TaxID=3077330 RepID=UPI0031BA67A5
MRKRAMLMISGGIDSAVMAYKMKAEGWDVFGVHVNSGQPNNIKDRRAVNTLSINLNIPIQVIEIPGLVNSFKGYLHPDYENYDQTCCETSRPFLAVTSVCGVYADITGFDTMAIGYLKEELDEYESRYSNLDQVQELFAQAVSVGRDKEFKIIMPLIQYSKRDIVRMAVDLGVPMETTWGCWDGRAFHCGECAGCLARKAAFSAEGIEDPTIYYS